MLDVTTDVPVDSIRIPPRHQRTCADWSGGQDCMLYAVASTGNLTTGTIRPLGCDTPEKWYLQIWRELSADVWRAQKLAIDSGADCSDLEELEGYVDVIVEGLEIAYGLEDWEPATD
jgi:hypothetical protein